MNTHEFTVRANYQTKLNHNIADTFNFADVLGPKRRKEATRLAIWQRRSADWFTKLDLNFDTKNPSA